MPSDYTIIYDTECVEIRRKPKKSIGAFSPIGRINNMTQNKKESNDLISRLTQISKSALLVFNELKNHHDPYNMFCYPPDTPMTKSQLTMYQVRIKELKDAGIVRKVKGIVKARHRNPGKYMINPYLVICSHDVEGTQRDWDDLA